MKIEDSTIKKIAHLSRLELQDGEEGELKQEIEKILDWMNQLKEVDTSAVEPLTHMHQNINIFREDKAANELSKAEGLFNAPLKSKDYFKVQKVKQ